MLLCRDFFSLRLCVFLILLLISSVSFSNENHQLSHQKIAPTVDGFINEAQWRNATVLDLNYDDVPGKGQPAPVKTTAYVYEDGQSLHVALYAYTDNTDQLRAHLSARDKARADDLLGIVIDTFNDERNAYEFFVNPLGVQIDARMTDNRGWKANDSWNATWHSAAQIVEDGWTAELSIPLKILRFADTQGLQTWGLAVYRSYQGESQQWLTNFKRDNQQNCNLCQFSKVTGFKDVKQSNNLQFIPGVTYTYHQEKADSTINDEWSGSGKLDASLDMSWAPTENSTLNATLNPDFSQVEADTAQLDINSPHTLSVAEKRTFFLDGAEYLTTDLLNLVHTRNITSPEYGLKYSGKSGEKSYGVLVANDQETRFVLPRNQSSEITSLPSNAKPSDLVIARYKQDLGEKSSLGVLYTDRKNTGYRNTVLSVDGKAALSGANMLHFQWAHTKSKNPLSLQNDHNLKEDQQGNALSVNFNRDLYRYTVSAAYQNVEKEFRSDLGFITQADYIGKQLNGSIKFYGQSDTWFKNGSTSAGYHQKKDRDGQLLEEKNSLSGYVAGKYHSNTTLTFDKKTQRLIDGFSDTQTYFKLNQVNLNAKFQPISDVKLTFLATKGDAIDYHNEQRGQLQRVKAEADLYLGSQLNIKFSHEYRAINAERTQHLIEGQWRAFDAGNIFKATQNDVRISYQFNTKMQLKLISQYTQVDRNTALYRANYDNNPDNDIYAAKKTIGNQLVFSYKFNAESLFYLGYSDQGANEPMLDALEINDRRVFSKFSYAWRN